MTIFDVIRYPILPGETYMHVVWKLPSELRRAFFSHPEFREFPNAYADITKSARRDLVDQNTELIRRIIREWDTNDDI